MSKFNVGDTIRIIRGSELMPHRFAGRTATVERFDAEDNTYHVRLSSGTFWWAHERDLSGSVASAHVAAEATRSVDASHEFKPGDQGQTVEGKTYEVLASVPRPEAAEYPLLVRIDGGAIEEYTIHGRFLAYRTSDVRNLVPPKKSLTRYVNVYADGMSCGYPTPEAAKAGSLRHALIVAHPVTVELPC